MLLLAAAVPYAWSSTPNSITLEWTAPGNDAGSGRASRYELRYSKSSVGADTSAWWSGARIARSLPMPSPSGQIDSAVVTGLDPETTYYFILRSFDEYGDASGFSNVASGATAPGVPIAMPAHLHAYPNPSSDVVQFVIHVQGPSGEQVRIRLFDLTGRLVADIADGSFPSGDTTVSWPRLTLRGDRVAPGYYESVGTVGQTVVRERLVLLP